MLQTPCTNIHANKPGIIPSTQCRISHAHGEYVYFMDSDDLLEEDAMELCYHKCEEEKLDFVFFDAQSFRDGNVRNAPALNYKRTDKLENKVYTGTEALELQLKERIYTPSVCLILSADLSWKKSGCNSTPVSYTRTSYSRPCFICKPEKPLALNGHSSNGVSERIRL